MPPDESFDVSAEDRRPNTPSPAPRDTGSASGQAVCHRRTGRQATSAVAYTGDPLLCFAPYLHPHPRSNSITPERQRRFIATLAATGVVTQAARESSFCLPLRYLRRRGKSMEARYKLRAKPGGGGVCRGVGCGAGARGTAAGGLCALFVWPTASHLEANRARTRWLAGAQTFSLHDTVSSVSGTRPQAAKR